MKRIITGIAAILLGGSLLVVQPTTSQATGGGYDSIVICHNNRTIAIDESAWPAHKAHGDSLGACPCAPAPTVTVKVPGPTVTATKTVEVPGPVSTVTETAPRNGYGDVCRHGDGHRGGSWTHCDGDRHSHRDRSRSHGDDH